MTRTQRLGRRRGRSTPLVLALCILASGAACRSETAPAGPGAPTADAPAPREPADPQLDAQFAGFLQRNLPRLAEARRRAALAEPLLRLCDALVADPQVSEATAALLGARRSALPDPAGPAGARAVDAEAAAPATEAFALGILDWRPGVGPDEFEALAHARLGRRLRTPGWRAALAEAAVRVAGEPRVRAAADRLWACVDEGLWVERGLLHAALMGLLEDEAQTALARRLGRPLPTELGEALVALETHVFTAGRLERLWQALPALPGLSTGLGATVARGLGDARLGPALATAEDAGGAGPSAGAALIEGLLGEPTAPPAATLAAFVESGTPARWLTAVLAVFTDDPALCAALRGSLGLAFAGPDVPATLAQALLGAP